MVIFPLAPDQTIAQMWSNGARGGLHTQMHRPVFPGWHSISVYHSFADVRRVFYFFPM